MSRARDDARKCRRPRPISGKISIETGVTGVSRSAAEGTFEDRLLAGSAVLVESRWEHHAFPPTAPLLMMGRGPRKKLQHPRTPDGRYFVVRGRLWRLSNPSLAEAERQRLVGELMDARRAMAQARRAADQEAASLAHAGVDAAKRALGERGLVWWNDGAPDLNRRMAKNTPYAAWFADIEGRTA